VCVVWLEEESTNNGVEAVVSEIGIARGGERGIGRQSGGDAVLHNSARKEK
jgi:hypothetical protein